MTFARRSRFQLIAVQSTLLAWVLACGADPRLSELLELPPAPAPRLVVRDQECRDRVPTAAYARRAEERAHLRLERYPYDPDDGLRGALLLLEARRCFERAGYPSDAARLSTAAAKVVSRLKSDFAAAHVALEHALREEDWAGALHHSRWFLAFVERGESDPYIEWVRGVASRVATYVDAGR
jgi:hypothetical protein